MPAGRPAKPLKIHDTEGTRRGDRHGKPSKVMATATGIPKMPTGLGESARELWKTICKQQREYLSESDGVALQALCESWGLREKALWHAKRKPLDKDIRCAFTAYHQLCEKLLAKFGMTPSDRARLGEVSQADFDPAAEFIA